MNIHQETIETTLGTTEIINIGINQTKIRTTTKAAPPEIIIVNENIQISLRLYNRLMRKEKRILKKKHQESISEKPKVVPENAGDIGNEMNDIGNEDFTSPE